MQSQPALGLPFRILTPQKNLFAVVNMHKAIIYLTRVSNDRLDSITYVCLYIDYPKIWGGGELKVGTGVPICVQTLTHPYTYTPSQRGNYHHSMFHNPTAAVNLFHVGKQYLTLCKAKAAVTRNLIGRKIISNVKHSDARISLPILDVIRSSHKRHSASEYCK